MEFLDPPDPNWSFRTLEQCLDVLASLDIFQDFCPDSELEENASPDTTNGQYHDQQHTEVPGFPVEEISSLVIVLLASVAISLVILALLGTFLHDHSNILNTLTNRRIFLALRHGVSSQSFRTVALEYSALDVPLAKSFAVFKAFFLPILQEAQDFAPGQMSAPSPQSLSTRFRHNSPSHGSTTNLYQPAPSSPEIQQTSFHQSSSSPSLLAAGERYATANSPSFPPSPHLPSSP